MKDYTPPSKALKIKAAQEAIQGWARNIDRIVYNSNLDDQAGKILATVISDLENCSRMLTEAGYIEAMKEIEAALSQN